MDPLTHFAAPAAAVLALRGRRGEAALAGLGGLLPDVEKGVQIAWEWVGSDFLLFAGAFSHLWLDALAGPRGFAPFLPLSAYRIAWPEFPVAWLRGAILLGAGALLVREVVLWRRGRSSGVAQG